MSKKSPKSDSKNLQKSNKESAGIYIVIEGQDGTGKTTHLDLLSKYFKNQGREVEIINESAMNRTGLPSTNALVEAFLNKNFDLDPMTNVLLITAVRSELWRKISEPALAQGKVVLSTRNWFSTLAYQHFGQGVSREIIENTTKEFLPERYVKPDLSVILTLSDDERARRIKTRNNNSAKDTFESQGNDFQTRVNRGYEQIARELHAPIVDASGTIDQVFADILAELNL